MKTELICDWNIINGLTLFPALFFGKSNQSRAWWVYVLFLHGRLGIGRFEA